MKSIERIKELIGKNRELLGEKYKVKGIGIFGSCAKGRLQKGSDIDVLVEFYEPPDLFEFIRLEEFLKGLLGRKVDLVSRKALKPLIRDEILKATVYL